MSCTSGSAYAIKPGDTLYLIAQRELGNGDRWREIMKPDGIPYTEAEASNLQVGQEICLPNGSVPQPPSPPPDRCRFFTLGWGQDKEDKEGK